MVSFWFFCKIERTQKAFAITGSGRKVARFGRSGREGRLANAIYDKEREEAIPFDWYFMYVK